MGRLLEVCLVGLTAAGGIAWGAGAAGKGQTLQAGIHVELPVTRNAVLMREADEAGALVVSIAENGRVYAGVTPVSPATLEERVKSVPSNATATRLYVKGDARTAYGNVEAVLRALRVAGIEELSVLTEQRESPAPGKLVAPKGLEVLLGSRAPAGSEPATIELVRPEQGRPMVKIDSQHISWGSLPGALKSVLRGKKVAVVRAGGTVPFGNVVDVADMCRGTGVRVVLGP